MTHLEELIGKCEYHARNAAEKHDFYVSKSKAKYADEWAKHSLDWATFFADIAEELKKGLPAT